MKGAYVLIIEVIRRVSFKLASLGLVAFEPGIWVYVGSAMGRGSTSLENRIKRHFRTQKSFHWHIDHLLRSKNAFLHKAYWAESQTHAECGIARVIEFGIIDLFMPGPRGFGASDCQSGCTAHIFLQSPLSDKDIEYVVRSVFEEQGLTPSITTDGNIIWVA